MGAAVQRAAALAGVAGLSAAALRPWSAEDEDDGSGPTSPKPWNQKPGFNDMRTDLPVLGKINQARMDAENEQAFKSAIYASSPGHGVARGQ